MNNYNDKIIKLYKWYSEQLLTLCWPLPSQFPSRVPQPAFSHSLYAEYIVWNVPLASWSQLSCLCPLPSLLTGRAREAEKSFYLAEALLSNNWKHQCVTNIIPILNPKHSTAAATRKKIYSIPAETWKTHFSNIFFSFKRIQTRCCSMKSMNPSPKMLLMLAYTLLSATRPLRQNFLLVNSLFLLTLFRGQQRDNPQGMGMC